MGPGFRRDSDASTVSSRAGRPLGRWTTREEQPLGGQAVGNLLSTVAVAVRQLDEAYPVAPDRQGEFAVLQGQRVLAKDFATPAGKRLDRRLVGGGDRFQIIGRSQQFLRDLMVLAALLQQHAQQLDQGSETVRRFRPRSGRRLRSEERRVGKEWRARGSAYE